MPGYVLPKEELERRGYVNYDYPRDPRAIARENQAIADKYRQLKEAQRFKEITQNLTRGKMYL